jgi:hypothetical protein
MSEEGNQIFGRIYKITSSETEYIYIGATTKTLKERLAKHKTQYKCYLDGKYDYVSSFDIIKFVNVNIELISEGLFDRKSDLYRLEGEYIQLTENCINKRIEGSTKQ